MLRIWLSGSQRARPEDRASIDDSVETQLVNLQSLQEIRNMRRIVRATILSAALIFGLGLNPARAQHGHEERDQKHGEDAREHQEKTGHSHEQAAAHGGVVTMSKEFHVETVFLPDQIRLYLYDSAQNPMHVKHWKNGLVVATGTVQFRNRGRGTATLEFEHAAPGGYVCPMHPDQRSIKSGECPVCEMKLSKQEIPEGTLWACPMHPDENGKAEAECADCGMKFTPQDYLVAKADLKGLSPGAAKAIISLTNLPGSKENKLQFAEKFVPSKVGETHGEAEGDEHGHGDHDH